MSLQFIPEGQTGNKPALVQVMTWCRIGHMYVSANLHELKKVYIYNV